MDAVTAILDDHRLLEELAERLSDAHGSTRARLAAELEIRFRVHDAAEKTCVHPVLDSAELAAEQPKAAWDFTEHVRRHIAVEERAILPVLLRAVSPDRLRELGQDFETWRVELLDRAGLHWSVQAI
ncbi:hypothetical protein [Phytomonospora endophytica]|uniref:Hemerythrin-like domain-containing protein n=1 Tax=Phytomonospora endophytica TaxID=714109 RepID=A0A841FR17_9ACTN|nr:hypothetical protein [Phytomonospora endophytica]MBB6037273.1 hemerythrin-like domain-containing protein [Phytomonospora endophytica]GIG69983.1 hypothetical protein Pen01_62780 [Phytomonospora endophytica]